MVSINGSKASNSFPYNRNTARCTVKQPVLFINACVRQESRTGRLAKKVLAKLDRPVEEVRLSEIDFPPVDAAFLKLRDRLIAEGNFDDPSFALARQFAQAATVVIAAPYWDLSFPAALKQYFEQINVVGVTFRYTADGRPVGLCRADKLIYVTTAGGTYVPEEFGYGYLEAMAKSFYGIPDVRLIKAVGLDIAGADVESILRSAEESIEKSNL
ncbi:MAG: NAD(P)H-dependent oxidoreductase [Clostridia bacterium]|nr:NAD(P)H-dependent oxidoreductase [Clostridia bacterium]